MKSHPASLLVALALFASGVAPAAPLASGNYRIQLQLGEALLNGRYPVFVNENVADAQPVEGRLDVTTDATGKISGKVEIFGEIAEVSGQLKTRSKSGTGLKLRGKTANGKRVTLKTRLQDGNLSGTVKLGKQSAPARINLEGVAPAALDYALALTVDADGKITGTGTLQSDVATQPVTIRGKTNDTSASLRVTGEKTMFEGKGPTTATGFTAKWKAQALGALLNGDNLAVSTK